MDGKNTIIEEVPFNPWANFSESGTLQKDESFPVEEYEDEEEDLTGESEYEDDDQYQTDEEVDNDESDEDGEYEEFDEEVSDENSEDDESEDSLEETPYAILAKSFQKEGLISDKDEIPVNLSGTELKHKIKERVIPEIRNEVFQEVLYELENQGITQEEIAYARAIRNGVPPEQLQVQSWMEYYATQNPSEISDEEKVDVIRKVKEFQNYSPDDIERLVNVIDLDGTLDQEFKKIQDGILKPEASKFLKEQEEYTERRLQEEQEKQMAAYRFALDVINKRQIGGETLTEKQAQEFERSLFVPSLAINLENNKVQEITEFDKFIIDLNTSLEAQLYLFKLYKFRGQETSTMREIARDEVEDELLSKLGKSVRTVNKTHKKVRNKNTFEIKI